MKHSKLAAITADWSLWCGCVTVLQRLQRLAKLALFHLPECGINHFIDPIQFLRSTRYPADLVIHIEPRAFTMLRTPLPHHQKVSRRRLKKQAVHPTKNSQTKQMYVSHYDKELWSLTFGIESIEMPRTPHCCGSLLKSGKASGKLQSVIARSTSSISTGTRSPHCNDTANTRMPQRPRVHSDISNVWPQSPKMKHTKRQKAPTKAFHMVRIHYIMFSHAVHGTANASH